MLGNALRDLISSMLSWLRCGSRLAAMQGSSSGSSCAASAPTNSATLQ